MPDELVIRHCAPTLTLIKRGNLFSCKYESREALYNSIRSLNHRLSGKGLRILPLRCADDGIARAAESVICQETPDEDVLNQCRDLGAALVQ